MSRNVAGSYTLPAGNPPVTGTTITVTWAQDTMDDIASELTDSLSRSGKGAMLAALKLYAGSVSAPGLSFSDETNTGFYRAGSGDIRFSRSGVDVLIIDDKNLTITATNPSLYLYESDASSNAKRWRIYADGGQLLFQSRSDDNSTSVTWLNVFRSGTTITDINFSAQTILLTASTQLTIAGLPVISAVTPRLRLYDSNAGSDAKYTEFNGNSGFVINLLDDSGLNPVTALAVVRTGTTADSITLTATTLVLSGAFSLPSITTGTTVGAAGGASALPATPTGYMTVTINGTARKIPYYAT